jgi:hypothetical protein
MRVAVFHTKSYDQQFLSASNAKYGHDLVFFELDCPPKQPN